MKQEINLEDKCSHQSELSKMLVLISKRISLTKKATLLRHLKHDPLYKCYFCGGYNYNCESYEGVGL